MESLFNTWLMSPATVFPVYLFYQFDRISFERPEAKVDANPKECRGEEPELDSMEGLDA